MKKDSVSKVGHYRSWYEVARKLKDPADRLAFYDALDAYRFEGVVPENLPPIVDILWTAIKPNIDADITCRISGADGGRKGGLQEIENPPFEFSASNVEEDVEEDADDEGGLVAPETSTPVENSTENVESWLLEKNLSLPAKDVKNITVFLALKSVAFDYLDYALEYVSSKTYKSRDGTGRISFADIPDGNKKGLFLDAVLHWQDMYAGYADWHCEQQAKARFSSPEIKRKPPCNCPSCGEPLSSCGGEQMCIKCNGYVEWGGVAWRIRPFETRTLAEGIPQMQKGA